ncbi:MAG: hypothetical protein ACTSRW_11550 [Candidatus Helarchaeota archaeon]
MNRVQKGRRLCKKTLKDSPEIETSAKTPLNDEFWDEFASN